MEKIMELGKVVKIFKSKKGNEVVVRYLKYEDLDDLLKFANALSEEDTFVMLSGEVLTREEELKYLEDSIESMEKGQKVHLVATLNGRVVANCQITREKKRKAHVGNLAISVAKAFREEGIGTELIKTLIEEGKKQLGLRLVTLMCFETNDRALQMYKKVGFKLAGVIPKIYLYKGEYVGEVLLYLPLV